MHLAPETVSLKNGKTAFLRSAEPGDAAAMIDYLKAAAGETPFFVLCLCGRPRHSFSSASRHSCSSAACSGGSLG